jgi:hypothetical protein
LTGMAPESCEISWGWGCASGRRPPKASWPMNPGERGCSCRFMLYRWLLALRFLIRRSALTDRRKRTRIIMVAMSRGLQSSMRRSGSKLRKCLCVLRCLGSNSPSLSRSRMRFNGSRSLCVQTYKRSSLRCFAGGHGFSRRPRRGFLPAGGDGLLMTPSINRYEEYERETRVLVFRGLDAATTSVEGQSSHAANVISSSAVAASMAMGCRRWREELCCDGERNCVAMAVAAAQQAMCQLLVMTGN